MAGFGDHIGLVGLSGCWKTGLLLDYIFFINELREAGVTRELDGGVVLDRKVGWREAGETEVSVMSCIWFAKGSKGGCPRLIWCRLRYSARLKAVDIKNMMFIQFVMLQSFLVGKWSCEELRWMLRWIKRWPESFWLLWWNWRHFCIYNGLFKLVVRPWQMAYNCVPQVFQ